MMRNALTLFSNKQVCNSTFASVEYYEHPKTAQWNEAIIVRFRHVV